MPETQYMEYVHQVFLDRFSLREITNSDSTVRAFELYGGEPDHNILLTFTPQGMSIQGRVGPMGLTGNGVLGGSQCTLEWFLAPKSNEDLLCPFFEHQTYQADVARQGVLNLAAQEVGSKQYVLVNLSASSMLEDQGRVITTLLSLGYDIAVSSEIGMAYPLDDAGWICAIQSRFRELYLAL